jgi:hypothetical protein
MKNQKKETAKNVKPVKKEAAATDADHRFSSAMEPFVERFMQDDVDQTKEYLYQATSLFRKMSERDLTLSQRRRKVGAGIRNYGFIVKAAELANENQQFAALFNIDVLLNCIYNYEESRNINNMLQSFMRQTSNSMLVYSDEAYSLSLIFYNSLKELARRGNADAITLFRTLQPFFRRRNPERGDKPPTEAETLRDVKALLHGKKDGEVVVKNQRPVVSKGQRVVIDETHKDKAVFKETEEGNM